MPTPIAKKLGPTLFLTKAAIVQLWGIVSIMVVLGVEKFRGSIVGPTLQHSMSICRWHFEIFCQTRNLPNAADA
jgi:hypothetical protein